MRISSKPIVVSAFLIAIGIISYFAVPIVKERYLSEETEEVEKGVGTDPESGNFKDEKSGVSEENLGIDVNEDENEETEETEAEKFAKEDVFMAVTGADCDKGCLTFTETEDIDYCKQVCGLVATEKKEGCDGLEDLQKDYCFKDLAVSKTDAKICEQIDDKNIRTTCTNRIMEDIIDKQNESRNNALIPE